MPTFIPKIPKVVIQLMPELALYKMMCSSHDFEDVKATLNNHTNWSIELFRSCFTIHLAYNNNFFTLSTMTFLIMAESLHAHYGRLSPPELKERAESMGYAMFATLFAVLDVGSIIVRVAGLIALSGTPGLAMTLGLVGLLPSLVFPFLPHAVELVRRRRRAPAGEGTEV